MAMLDFFKKFFPTFGQESPVSHRDLIKREAEIGGQIFGEVPVGHDRQFFCLDDITWVWFEQWKDEAGHPQSITTRYEVRPDGILKIQDGQPYRYVSTEEAQNLVQAAKRYHDLVSRHVYGLEPLAI